MLKSVGNGLRYEGVTFTYGNEPVLRDIDLDVAPGEIVALVGGSGAGKSTLVNLLPRFYDVTQGTDHHRWRRRARHHAAVAARA